FMNRIFLSLIFFACAAGTAGCSKSTPDSMQKMKNTQETQAVISGIEQGEKQMEQFREAEKTEGNLEKMRRIEGKSAR
ncbi:MAG: hypothetical protein PHE58_03755, partial [Candidatus Omnitrophica bacterium]|nr:hypothetical protein [Candidatus Omnitrophota bacterium]